MKPKPDAGIKEMLFQRLLSFGLVVGVGFLLLVSLLVSAGLSALNRYIGTFFPDVAVLWQGVNTLVSLGVITLLFAMIYQFLPDVDLRLQRRVGRRAGDGGAVHDREVPDRPLPGHQRRGIVLRRGRLGGGAADLGLLLVADRAAGGGVHPGVRGAVRRPAAAVGARDQGSDAGGGGGEDGEREEGGTGGQAVERCHPERSEG